MPGDAEDKAASIPRPSPAGCEHAPERPDISARILIQHLEVRIFSHFDHPRSRLDA
jgi:hypothetical protein